MSLHFLIALLDMICKDCHESGHANNHYFKCKLYKEESADDGNNQSRHTPHQPKLIYILYIHSWNSKGKEKEADW